MTDAVSVLVDGEAGAVVRDEFGELRVVVPSAVLRDELGELGVVVPIAVLELLATLINSPVHKDSCTTAYRY
jgi:hypothetical protein